MMTTIEVQLAKICILSNIVVGFNNIFYYFFRQFFRLHSNLYITLDFFSINRNNKIITSIIWPIRNVGIFSIIILFYIA